MSDKKAITFRAAKSGDGADLWRLIKNAGTLEPNTAYFYLIFAEHFGDTCLVAEQDGAIVGGVIAYRPPSDSGSVFVWQIGVAPAGRGQGLGKRLLQELMQLPACADARWLTATVADDNEISQRLFRGFARDKDVSCEESDFFTADMFPQAHEAERLFRIGPLNNP
ncbi:MAG TPA: diaminobutyrate acetyltransferase [Gammaproteobacteria bacterium]|nr:diaminobutyrate acetyltransferase [Gammaproteobacteria bacterium]